MSNDHEDIPVANIGGHKPPPSPLDNPETMEKMKEEAKAEVEETQETEAKQFDESKVKGIPTVAEFFSGFQTRYPEYEVITPQTLLEITVRSMKVQDEEAVKGSMVNRRQTPELVNKAIWSTLIKHPFEDYDDFLKKTTILDREALLYAVYHVTYKDIQNYELGCQKCEKSYGIKVELSNIFKMDAWQGEPNEVLGKRFEVELESVPNTVAIVKQPTLEDERKMLGDMLFQSDKTIDLGIEMLIVDKFIHNAEGRAPLVISERSDIFKAYKDMLPIDRKRINNTYLEQFGKYRIDLSMTSFCKHCGEENESGLDLLGQFFRALYG